MSQIIAVCLVIFRNSAVLLLVILKINDKLSFFPP